MSPSPSPRQDNATFDPSPSSPTMHPPASQLLPHAHTCMHAPASIRTPDNITFDPGFLFPNDAFTRLAHAMADAMGGPHRFDYIHVRRGDKLDARRWPHLDRDTRPEALLQKLPSLVPPNTTLYIATNEPHPHFFDPLKAAYSVYIQEDFESLWAKGSAWEAEMREVAASVGVAVGERVEFGSEMQVLVDYALKKLARRTVETFNDLTDDPKD
ncbi:unnamed protein product, partial [Closterium sp. Naga37s-1]